MKYEIKIISSNSFADFHLCCLNELCWCIKKLHLDTYKSLSRPFYCLKKNYVKGATSKNMRPYMNLISMTRKFLINAHRTFLIFSDEISLVFLCTTSQTYFASSTISSKPPKINLTNSGGRYIFYHQKHLRNIYF